MFRALPVREAVADAESILKGERAKRSRAARQRVP
ncbi:hypothetical protein STAFG_0076 [Streptomyces afghaniensis 772]|uniref:Uncharacterized protein n=1 Tax=Streptomyces afghaniensis 772 TaxID=1283301 RepID=S4N4B4_9ACTN|nr:hypothetical protein STAFG_0076 [Streptomyces afghaniensis 772]